MKITCTMEGYVDKMHRCKAVDKQDKGTGWDLGGSISLVFYNRFGQRLTFALLSDILFVHPSIISLLYYRCSSGFIHRSESLLINIGRTKNGITLALR